MATTLDRCASCNRVLDLPGDEDSMDCGGDCYGCVKHGDATVPIVRPPLRPKRKRHVKVTC